MQIIKNSYISTIINQFIICVKGPKDILIKKQDSMANEPFESGSLYISCWKTQTKINERPPPTRIAKISTRRAK